MTNKMTNKSRKTFCKKEFIQLFAKNLATTQDQAERIYEAYLETLSQALETGKPVLVGDMFRLQAKMRPASNCVNPRTKELMERAARPYLKCKLTSDFEQVARQWPIF